MPAILIRLQASNIGVRGVVHLPAHLLSFEPTHPTFFRKPGGHNTQACSSFDRGPM